MIFLEEKCERCGTCLIKCPYIEVSKKEAEKEIKNLIETKTKSDLLDKCIGCAFCDTVCPTKSNPSLLIREISDKSAKKEGIPEFYITSDKVPNNVTSIALSVGGKTLKQKIERFENPEKSTVMFYLGCGLSYVQTNLIDTALLEEYPKIGGEKYCCGAYVKSFGENEIKFKGKELLEEFTALGIKKLIIFCPGCLRMMNIYSDLIPQFKNKISLQTFSDYLVQKIRNGEITFKHKLNKKVAFHDPCAWRNLNKSTFKGPRKLLRLLGAEVMEMEHNYQNTLCCGSSASNISKDFYNEVSGMRIKEAQNLGVDYIVVSCTGCLSLAKAAHGKDIEVYHILELVEQAIGEEIPHKIIEQSTNFNNAVKSATEKNPKLISKKSVIKNGKIIRI